MRRNMQRRTTHAERQLRLKAIIRRVKKGGRVTVTVRLFGSRRMSGPLARAETSSLFETDDGVIYERGSRAANMRAGYC